MIILSSLGVFLLWFALSMWSAFLAGALFFYCFVKVFTEDQVLLLAVLAALNAFAYTFYWGMGWI